MTAACMGTRSSTFMIQTPSFICLTYLEVAKWLVWMRQCLLLGWFFNTIIELGCVLYAFSNEIM
jgi:hypothetical protein